MGIRFLGGFLQDRHGRLPSLSVATPGRAGRSSRARPWPPEQALGEDKVAEDAALLLALLYPVFPRSRAFSLSLLHRGHRTLARAADRHCRRSEPPGTNRRHRNGRHVLLCHLTEPRKRGGSPSPGIEEIPRLRRWASSLIPSSPAIPVPLRAYERLQGEFAQPLDLSSLSPVLASCRHARFPVVRNTAVRHCRRRSCSGDL